MLPQKKRPRVLLALDGSSNLDMGEELAGGGGGGGDGDASRCASSLPSQSIASSSTMPQNRTRSLLDEFLQDLTDIVMVPFFDNELPLEIVVKVFRYLSISDLGRCASVSRSWKHASEDNDVWLDVAVRHGWTDLNHWTLRHYEGRIDIFCAQGPGGTTDSVRWKNVCWIRHGYHKVMQRNWAERYCSVHILDGGDEGQPTRRRHHTRRFDEEDATSPKPTLTAVWVGNDRVLGGRNDGVIRNWTAAEAAVEDWIDTRGLHAAASAVRIVLRERGSLQVPIDADAQQHNQQQPAARRRRQQSQRRAFQRDQAGGDLAISMLSDEALAALLQEGVIEFDDENDHTRAAVSEVSQTNEDNDEIDDMLDIASVRARRSPGVIERIVSAGARVFGVVHRASIHDAADWPHTDWPDAVATSQATLSDDLSLPTVHVWDMHTAKHVAVLPFPLNLINETVPNLDTFLTQTSSARMTRALIEPMARKRRALTGLVPFRDGSRLVGAVDDGHLVLWDAVKSASWEVAHVVRAHEGTLSHCTGFELPGERRQQAILTGCNDTTGGARIFVINEGESILELRADLASVDKVLVQDADAEHLIVASTASALGSHRHRITVFDTATAVPIGNLFDEAWDFREPTCIHYCDAPPHQLVIGFSDGSLDVFDLRTYRAERSLGRHTGSVLAVQMDATKVVSGGYDRRTHVLDLRSGSTMWATEDAHPVRYIKFTDRLLVTASYPLDPGPYDPFSDTFITPGQLRIMDFSPAANWSRVQLEFTSVFDTGPAASRHAVIMSAPYTQLL